MSVCHVCRNEQFICRKPGSYQARSDDVVYGHKDGLALTLDVVEPEQNRKGIGLILVSSGSWESRKSNIPEENRHRFENDHWGMGLLKGGFTLFVVRHGSGPRYSVPEMIPDMNRAVRFVRSIAKKYEVDPESFGNHQRFSSGGHLVPDGGDDGR